MAYPYIVLHVNGRLDRGGAESRIMDLYRAIDREKVQFHFVEHTTDRCAYEEEIESLGGKVYHLPRFNMINIVAYRKAWKELLQAHTEIQTVHGHMTSTAGIYLPIAKKIGKKTIAHARSAGVEPGVKGKLTRFLRRNLWKQADTLLTCSKEAGISVFGKQAVDAGMVRFFPNAIPVDKFAFQQEVRKQVRDELGLLIEKRKRASTELNPIYESIETTDKAETDNLHCGKLKIDDNTFVLGHVGRFSPVKNHKYLLQIMVAYCKKNPNTVLLLLGDGPTMEETKAQAKEMGIADKVLFLGNHSDVYRYYNAMDCFLLPSFYEGLPGTAIEAQACGLPGLLSDTITREAAVTELMEYVNITESPEVWAEKLETIQKKTIDARENYANAVKAAGFDVAEQAEKLQRFYLSNQWA